MHLKLRKVKMISKILYGFIGEGVLTHENRHANVNHKHVFSHKFILDSLNCPENSQMFKVHWSQIYMPYVYYISLSNWVLQLGKLSFNIIMQGIIINVVTDSRVFKYLTTKNVRFSQELHWISLFYKKKKKPLCKHFK